MSVALRRRLSVVGATLAASGHIRLPEGPAAVWSEEEVARVVALVNVCGRALLTRLDNDELAVLAERGSRGRDEEAAISPAGTSSPPRCR